MTKTINVQDFSAFPGPRFIKLGDYSGEEFRDTILIPALAENDVIVNLDGVFGFGSSFLEEVFGGLIRAKISRDKVLFVRNNLISEDDPSLILEIHEYIDDALGKS
ncbi:STAS-like domain-containing protein [Aliivibrio wodanis]|uniref:STAS-like domain-containing protein n=1 Tax=Aliivibrio wodanis TaxID=80852 RepID=UPI00406D3C85